MFSYSSFNNSVHNENSEVKLSADQKCLKDSANIDVCFAYALFNSAEFKHVVKLQVKDDEH